MKRALAFGIVFAVLVLDAAAAAGPGADANPPAPGFDSVGSDERAIEIADEVTQAMGGRAAWDATRHLRWRFFGRRLHVWDRYTGDLRIEGVDRESGTDYVILMNLHSGTGRAWRSGAEVTDEDDLAAMLDRGEALWINDSYWMFMPFKLKDTGVTLRLVGQGRLEDGREADILELTFQGVGRTPENKYHVYVGKESRLVEQWAFFAVATDAEPRFTNPWSNWRRYGSILLSDGRGNSAHSEIAVFEELPEAIYRDPTAVDWLAIMP